MGSGMSQTYGAGARSETFPGLIFSAAPGTPEG